MKLSTDKELRELAHKRVEFRRHLLVFVVINGALWTIWYFTGQGYKWPVWPLIGWGIGLVFHYFFDYRSSPLLSEENEYIKIKKEVEEQRTEAS